MNTRRDFLKGAALGGAVCLGHGCRLPFAGSANELEGWRFLTVNCILRVKQVEMTRDSFWGNDESEFHTPEAMKRFSEAVRTAVPDARITWAFSWFALHDQRPNYKALRSLAAEYHRQYGDAVTFIPGGYFAPMYSSRKQVNADIHEAIGILRGMLGKEYTPDSLEGGFLSAENLRYLAEEENIHVAQGTIWSQYGIDNGDGDGSICYPYYPSREHVCKPARGRADFIDCVNLDGWTVDFLCARRFGFEDGFNSRLGVGPVEAYAQKLDIETGKQEVWSVTEQHFCDANVRTNGFGWLTVCWELSLVTGHKKSREMTECLTWWLKKPATHGRTCVCPRKGSSDFSGVGRIRTTVSWTTDLSGVAAVFSVLIKIWKSPGT